MIVLRQTQYWTWLKLHSNVSTLHRSRKSALTFGTFHRQEQKNIHTPNRISNATKAIKYVCSVMLMPVTVFQWRFVCDCFCFFAGMVKQNGQISARTCNRVRGPTATTTKNVRNALHSLCTFVRRRRCPPINQSWIYCFTLRFLFVSLVWCLSHLQNLIIVHVRK